MLTNVKDKKIILASFTDKKNKNMQKIIKAIF